MFYGRHSVKIVFQNNFAMAAISKKFFCFTFYSEIVFSDKFLRLLELPAKNFQLCSLHIPNHSVSEAHSMERRESTMNELSIIF